MAETNRTGTFQEVPGGASRSTYAGASSRATYPPRDVETRGSERRIDYDERRRRRTANLFLEDSIVLLGVLLGGAAGYMAASTVRGSDWSSRSRRVSGRGDSSRYFNQQGRAAPSSPVEKDETTDLIASNKVEGTAVYNRQGEKLGEVYNFMVGKRSGQVAYAIMSFGGFLGIGQKYHPLPWNALTYDTGKKGYVVDADRERLMAAPSYGAGEEPFSQPEYGRQVRDYWSSDLT
jgi:hypothetical protein